MISGILPLFPLRFDRYTFITSILSVPKFLPSFNLPTVLTLYLLSERAATYGLPSWHRKINDKVAKEMIDRLEWMGLERDLNAKREDVTLLDYACGTGLVSLVSASVHLALACLSLV